jgi:hypothetical protein
MNTVPPAGQKVIVRKVGSRQIRVDITGCYWCGTADHVCPSCMAKADKAAADLRDDTGADGKLQLVIPGAERASITQRKADAPLKPRVAQKPADIGLFSDERDQTDMFGGSR